MEGGTAKVGVEADEQSEGAVTAVVVEVVEVAEAVVATVTNFIDDLTPQMLHAYL